MTAFIARWPGVVPRGSESDALIEYVDVVPTLIDVAGGRPPAHLDGRSFLPVLRGETRHHKDVVFGIQTTRGITNGSEHYGIRSIRSERYKLILNLTPEVAFENNITNQRGKWSSYWQSWLGAAERCSRPDGLPGGQDPT